LLIKKKVPSVPDSLTQITKLNASRVGQVEKLAIYHLVLTAFAG